MNLGFEQLSQISNKSEWKQAYSSSIKNLDALYQEEEKLYYLMYSQDMENQRIGEIQQIKHELMTNGDLIHTLQDWKSTFKDDPTWHRRLKVFLSKMKQEALDSQPDLVRIQQKLQNNLMNSRFEINGNEYNLGSVHATIMDHPNRELRRKLFQETKRIGSEHEDLYRTLIKKRNELARAHEYDSYYHFRCSLKEIDIDMYFEEMRRLLEKSKGSFTYWNNKINAKFGWEKTNFYDQYYTTFNFHRVPGHLFSSERIKEALGDAASSIGVPLQNLPLTIEVMEIPYGGFAVNIHPENLKLVVNKRDAYSVFLSGIHELGHALDGYYASYKYPELYRFYSSIAAESIAELVQTIVTDPDFLRANFELDDEALKQIKEVNVLTDLKMVQINYYYSLVEYELYKDPERSFQVIADECYRDVFGYEGETFHPGSEMFYIENPAFFQDYNYALAIRDMIRAKYKIHTVYNERDVFGRFMEHFIVPNQLFSWQERVKRVCGEDFTFSYLGETIENAASSHD